jgi:hypothetical protein
MQAKPLSEFLEDEVFPANGWKTTICNIINVYRQEFNIDAVEQTFAFPEVVVGDDWELYATFSEEEDGIVKYAILDKKGQEEATLLPAPKTISDFIDDCYRVWNKDLVFDGNLIKRNFTFK